jgi:hypothetical protein
MRKLSETPVVTFERILKRSTNIALEQRDLLSVLAEGLTAIEVVA